MGGHSLVLGYLFPSWGSGRVNGRRMRNSWLHCLWLRKWFPLFLCKYLLSTDKCCEVWCLDAYFCMRYICVRFVGVSEGFLYFRVSICGLWTGFCSWQYATISCCLETPGQGMDFLGGPPFRQPEPSAFPQYQTRSTRNSPIYAT